MLTQEIKSFLSLDVHRGPVPYTILNSDEEQSYTRQLIHYLGSEADEIKAYLFIPKQKVIGSVLVHHQHASERHLGKSEVAGILGDPFQHFCPALAEKGILCLAPDSICFEDRRRNTQGTAEDEEDMLQHYNEMAYRLLQGTLLMKKVLDDASIAISLLASLEKTPKDKIGILGHSYGGNTVLFQAPFDERIKYSCSSGAVCTYRTKLQHDTGIELAEVIPGFIEKYEITDLLKGVCPRHFLIVASDEDIYSQDADQVYEEVLPYFQEKGFGDQLELYWVKGPHELDQDRFDYMIDWFVDKMGN